MLCLCMHVAHFGPLTEAWYLGTICIFHNMATVIHDAHIIHYHMDPAQLVVLVWCYFTHNNYLIVQCWIRATLLDLTIITPVGAPHV